VDEAQDLLTPENIIALELLVKGGLEKGRWSMFIDPNQKIYGAEADKAIEILGDADMPRTNCWRTVAIRAKWRHSAPSFQGSTQHWTARFLALIADASTIGTVRI